MCTILSPLGLRICLVVGTNVLVRLFSKRCEGPQPAPCVGVLLTSSIAMNGSVWLLLHCSIMCLAALTPDSALPLVFACACALAQCLMSQSAVNSRNLSALYWGPLSLINVDGILRASEV